MLKCQLCGRTRLEQEPRYYQNQHFVRVLKCASPTDAIATGPNTKYHRCTTHLPVVELKTVTHEVVEGISRDKKQVDVQQREVSRSLELVTLQTKFGGKECYTATPAPSSMRKMQ